MRVINARISFLQQNFLSQLDGTGYIKMPEQDALLFLCKKEVTCTGNSTEGGSGVEPGEKRTEMSGGFDFCLLHFRQLFLKKEGP